MIKYLYCKHWEWNKEVSKFEVEEMNGHPKTGQIYRSIFNAEVGTYRLVVPNQPLIGLSEIKTNNSENNAYYCDFDEITKSTILDYHLDESSLDQLNNWLDNKNQDLMSTPHPIEILQRAMMEQENQDADRIASTVSQIDDLNNVNSTQVDIIGEIVELLTESNLDEEEPLTLDINHGAGINISRAIGHLNTYICGDRRINEDRSDLLCAIKHLVVELERRNLNDLDI